MTVDYGYNARGETGYEYDDLGRLVCAEDPDGTATWAYDPAGGDGLLEERSYGTSASSGCAIGTAAFTEAYDYDTDAPETVTTTR